MSDTKSPGRDTEPGQAARAAEVDEMIRRAKDPDDPYDGSHPEDGRGGEGE